MKYKLQKPELKPVDMVKLNFLANYFGWILKFNLERCTALFETSEHDVGYIQTDENNQVFIVWKSTETVQYINQQINIICNMDNLIKTKKRKAKHIMDILKPSKEELQCLTIQN